MQEYHLYNSRDAFTALRACPYHQNLTYSSRQRLARCVVDMFGRRFLEALRDQHRMTPRPILVFQSSEPTTLDTSKK